MRYLRPLRPIAILLGLTAVVTALTPGPPAREEPVPPPPARSTAERGAPRPDLRLVTFAAEDPRTRRVPAGAHVAVRVEVERPGDVAIPTLGLIQSAAPGTPAVFDLLESEPRTLPLTFTPVGEGERPAGTLVVVG